MTARQISNKNDLRAHIRKFGPNSKLCSQVIGSWSTIFFLFSVFGLLTLYADDYRYLTQEASARKVKMHGLDLTVTAVEAGTNERIISINSACAN